MRRPFTALGFADARSDLPVATTPPRFFGVYRHEKNQQWDQVDGEGQPSDVDDTPDSVMLFGSIRAAGNGGGTVIVDSWSAAAQTHEVHTHYMLLCRG